MADLEKESLGNRAELDWNWSKMTTEVRRIGVMGIASLMMRMDSHEAMAKGSEADRMLMFTLAHLALAEILQGISQQGKKS